MHEPGLRITRRHLPHWTLTGSVYFVTFRLLQGSLTQEERKLILEHLRSGEGRYYDLAAATVMPEHVHLLIKPLADFSLSRIMKGIKGVSARRLDLLRRGSGSIWQDESWDRIMRDAAEFEEKLQYMLDNPVKLGLVQQGEDYDGWYFNPKFA